MEQSLHTYLLKTDLKHSVGYGCLNYSEIIFGLIHTESLFAEKDEFSAAAKNSNTGSNAIAGKTKHRQ